jgi:hypothetical protein
MKNIGLVFLGLALVVFSSCKTARVASQSAPPQPPRIDYNALQDRLGFEMKSYQVGYREKIFDACSYQSELPPMKDCHHAYFVLAQFQLSCRASEESSSILTAADLQPVAEKSLKWRAGKNHGEIETDRGGFGQIRTISENSMKRQQLRVSTGKDFLVIVAGQATNIVTPPSWCE